MTIDKLIRNVENIDSKDLLQRVLKGKRDELKTLQQKQMIEGKKSDGSKIGKYKSKSYRKFKFGLNVLAGYGNVDLRLSGDFQKRISIAVSSGFIKFTSIDTKTNKLVRKYGKEIFGLAPAKRETVAEKIQPEYSKLFKQNVLR